MTEIKIFDFQDCVDLTDNEAQAVQGGSTFSHWLHKHWRIKEQHLIDLVPTNTTPEPTGLPTTYEPSESPNGLIVL